MNPFGFQALSGLWLALLAAPLVLFYFLKLKRPRLEVPSLMLWRQVIADQRVNSPFQRFKRNLLLLAQLLLLALLVAAATQPYWRGGERRLERLPVLIDCSASMAALDKTGGVSRLDEAKKRVGRLIDNLGPKQQLCLVSFSDSARKLCDFTDNKRVLREALDGIAVDEVAGNVEEALRMAQSLMRSVSFDKVLLLSDGNFDARARVELSFQLEYQQLPPGGANMGITELSARRAADGRWNVFARIEATGDATHAAMEISVDGRLVDTQDVALGAQNARRLMFRVSGEAASAVAVRLAPDGFDALAADNVAFLDLPALRSLWVYVPENMGTYRHALAALEGVRLFPAAGAANPSDYDLVISDRREDLGLAALTRLFVGLAPTDAQALLRTGEKGVQVIDWRRDEALLQHVELKDLIVLHAPVNAAGVGEGDYENLGYETVIHGSSGPLMLVRRGGGRADYYLLFDSDKSTLPYRVGFPIMAANLVQSAMFNAGLAEARAVPTGALPALRVPAGAVCRVGGPGGLERSEKADPSGLLTGVPARRVGIYEVFGDGVTRQRIGVSLLSSQESGLAGVEAIEFNEQMKVGKAGVEALRTDRPLWPLLVMLGFAALLVEWWLFQRRPGGARL